MRRLPVIFVIYYLLISICYAQPTLEWVRTYPDTDTVDDAVSYALVLDDSGNVYITGHTADNTPVMNGYCTIKYSPSGIRQWVANYYGMNTGGRYSYDIALDKFSNVYVTGYSLETTSFVDYCTVKYNSNGVQQWVRNYNGAFNGQDEAQKIAVDSAGNIYVSGFTRTSTGFVITTIKYSPNGDTLWVRNYGNGVPVASVNGMMVDEECNIYITGSYNRAFTIKYDSTGTQLWLQGYGNGRALSRAIDVDKYHNVYIAGYYDVFGNFSR